MNQELPKTLTDLLLTRLRRELFHLQATALIEPLFAITLTQELYQQHLKMLAMVVKIAEHVDGKRDDSLRARQLEHAIGCFQTDFASVIKTLDDNPKIFTDAMNVATAERKTILDILNRKPSA